MPTAEGLTYCEEGTHDTGTRSLTAARRYRYVIGNNHVEVLFEDGRLFHSFVLAQDPWHVNHVCANDEYAGTFTKLGANSWQAEWDVHGPEKDYLSTTTYRRIGPVTLQ